ncbi:oxygen-independent coproporphyrinogen III oxidase [Gilvimarinus algae]|uniref:Coproporphyrinogen-III oxidase n=1 Tax=Gilvimarinus algae TaxID=3058037 RepID=A0ABT8TNM9_9GAMM|nr:oxygen-independent coproporphyrinogen III oxidase [Gilvimarinus sp. SDUM040014]MDO3384012.1 oxygen-independent coproporphyrinogen III oxidase [Gilvimarinus sp. SDUM040014]
MNQSVMPLHSAAELIDRYDLSGPRYTSYPTAPQMREDFAEVELLNALARSVRLQRPLSLYFHLPFCQSLCYYCGCNKVVTQKRQRVLAYLRRLEQEMADYAALLGSHRPVRQLHWGGGTPSYLSDDEMHLLMQMTRRHFHLADDDSGDFSVEIHPGQTAPSTLGVLRELGFNRVSMGVQDFDEKVQAAVNRHNSRAQVEQLMTQLRRHQFRSVNMDLIYGLPHQSAESFAHTLEVVQALRPDRISLFNYAHMPERFNSQRLIHTEHLPSPAQKLEIFTEALDRLTDSGYIHIGMDHFALPDDELAVAQREGRLQRNFQGYVVHNHCDLLGLGVSSISSVGDVYWQNTRRIDTYQQRLDQGKLAVERGKTLSRDDQIRRYVISELICHFSLSFAELQYRFGIDPFMYFAPELAELNRLAKDRLLTLDSKGISVSGHGRLLIRRICMVFDTYLADSQVVYSRVI